MSGIEEEPRGEHEFADAFGEDLVGWLSGESTADTAEAPAAEVVEDDGADTGDAAREAVVDETGRHHDPETGKFVEKPDDDSQESESQEGEETEETPEGESAEDEQEESDDDFVIEVDDEETAERVQAVLEKYDGDPAKALIALTEAQALIGKKELGQEYAQANAEVEALKAKLEAIEQGQQTMLQRLSQPVVPITRDLIEENPAAAAQQAVLQDNVEALQAAVSAWQNGTDYADANPEAARLFLEKLALEAQLAEIGEGATAGTATDPSQADLDAEVQKVKDRHPDIEQYLPAIGEAADENPLLKRAMETGTPSERAQALEALTVIAKSRQGADTSREALKRVQIRVKQEADDARKSARVVSASRRSAATASQPTRVDQFLAEFDARMGLNRDED